MTTPIERRAMIAASHKAQWAGVDYQAAAIAIADVHGIDYSSDDFTLLQSSPDADCECGFCANAYGSK